MKIEDDFLKQEDFDKIEKLITGVNFPWYYNDMIVSTDEADKFQFTHLFYDSGTPQSPFMNELGAILNIIKPLSLLRIKTNLLTRTLNIVENKFHIVENKFHVDISQLKDFPEKLKQWTTSIFYVNTNDGYTKFEDGTKVKSVANRMLNFPANVKHTGTSCTDEKIRVVINFNYFEFESEKNDD